MRRFPAPSGNAGPSTPHATRSQEAPMQYEWEKPRQFPASPFLNQSNKDGEPARKRTHYEAMDVDTPPRTSALPPPSAAANVPLPADAGSNEAMSIEPLSFDAKQFDAKAALGLQQEEEAEEIVMADRAEDLVDDEDDFNVGRGNKENMALVRGDHHPAGTRRRKVNSSAKGPKRRNEQSSRGGVTIETDEEGDTDEDTSGGGFLGTLQKKVGKRAGEFSFQVHHHHAAPHDSTGSGQVSTPERWLQSNTPYVLLGYLQFGALTLFAVLVLSLLLLFLYTLYTDIQTRLSSLTLELRSEILQCAKAYVDNRCEPSTRIPAMERRCSDWEECMNREVVVTGKTRVVAETLAEIVNGFVDVISFKTMLFVLLTLGITIYGSSAALSLLSSRATQHHPPLPPNYYAQPPPGSSGYPPYGLPYTPQTPWVIENGSDGQGQRQLGLGGSVSGLGRGEGGSSRKSS